jgi:hypothetical protein
VEFLDAVCLQHILLVCSNVRLEIVLVAENQGRPLRVRWQRCGGTVFLSAKSRPGHASHSITALLQFPSLLNQRRQLLKRDSSSTLTMHTSEYDYLFKLLLIGDSGVGKVRAVLWPPMSICSNSPVVLSPSAVCRRYIHGKLHQHYWCGLQDSYNRARGKDRETPDCEWFAPWFLYLSVAEGLAYKLRGPAGHCLDTPRRL